MTTTTNVKQMEGADPVMSSKPVFADREERFDYWWRVVRIHLSLVSRTLHAALTYLFVVSGLLLLLAIWTSPGSHGLTVEDLRHVTGGAAVGALYGAIFKAGFVYWRWYRDERADLREQFASPTNACDGQGQAP